MLSLSYFLSVSLVLFRTFSLVLASETELTNKICRREKCSWTNQILMNQISWRIGALNVCHFSAIERFQLTDCSCWKIVLSTPCDAEIQKEACRQCVVWASWEFGKKVTVSCTLLSLACPLSGWSPKSVHSSYIWRPAGFTAKRSLRVNASKAILLSAYSFRGTVCGGIVRTPLTNWLGVRRTPVYI